VTVIGLDPAKDTSVSAPGWRGFDVSDVDEFHDLCVRFFYPVRLERHRRSDQFGVSFQAANIGAVTVGLMRYRQTLRISVDDLVTSYHVNLPLTGRMVSTHRNVTVTADRGRGLLYGPLGSSSFDPQPTECRLLTVKIDRAALEGRLQEALDREITGPVAIAPSMDVFNGPGRSWAQLAGLLATDAANSGSLTGNSIVAARLVESLIGGLLVAVDHPYREEMTRPERSWHPRPLQRAVDAMEADPTYPFSVAELAGLAGVSVRALQAIFRRHVGSAPMACLRELRLTRAHEELCRARPGVTTVALVANRWGFSHLGRFAAAYRERYGVSPSVTLRL
jgi:AraC-like DNA-binding protein